MDRIAATFARAREDNRACFVSYLCAGDPDYRTSLACCRAALEGGSDILEIGVPFSDPLADGLTNQLAAQRALESGITMADVLRLAREIRRETDRPIVFYTYYNLVFANGVHDYIARLREAGVDAMLTLDLPPEEADEVLAASAEAGLKNIFIVAPTTSERRLQAIARVASGFVYYVSREGVTGVRDTLAGDIGTAVARIRSVVTLPVVVGFGISTPAQVNAVARVADGVVVGSALVNCIKEHLDDRDAVAGHLRARVSELAAGVRRQ